MTDSNPAIIASEKRYDTFSGAPKTSISIFCKNPLRRDLLVDISSHHQVSMFLLGQPKQFHIIVNQNKTGYEHDLIQLIPWFTIFSTHFPYCSPFFTMEVVSPGHMRATGDAGGLPGETSTKRWRCIAGKNHGKPWEHDLQMCIYIYTVYILYIYCI